MAPLAVRDKRTLSTVCNSKRIGSTFAIEEVSLGGGFFETLSGDLGQNGGGISAVVPGLGILRAADTLQVNFLEQGALRELFFSECRVMTSLVDGGAKPPLQVPLIPAVFCIKGTSLDVSINKLSNEWGRRV